MSAADSGTGGKGRRRGPALHWQILTGIALGAVYGIFLPHWTQYIEWIGDLFLNALNMIVIPLIASSIFIGVAGMAGGNLGRVLGKTLTYYLLTTLTAVVIGLGLVSIIKPGTGRDVVLSGNAGDIAAQDVHMIDQLTGIVPSNIFAAMADGNILPIIFFMVLLGIFSTKLEKKHYTVLLDFFTAVYELIMKVTMAIIKLTPIGIFSVMACMIGAQAGDPDALTGIVKGLGLFVITVWAGCLIHGGLILPGTVRVLARINPYRHGLRRIREAGRPYPLAGQYRQHERNGPLRVRLCLVHSTALRHRPYCQPADYSSPHIPSGSCRLSRHTYGRNRHDDSSVQRRRAASGGCRYNSCSTAGL